MEGIYESHVSDSRDVFTFVTAAEVEQGEALPERKLLSAGVHTEIAKTLQVPELSGEVERAVWQVNQGLKKEQQGQKDNVPSQTTAHVEPDHNEKNDRPR